jgi:hypothetical protein
MRHNEIHLTANIYTHIQRLHLASEVKKLPVVLAETNALESTPNLAKTGMSWGLVPFLCTMKRGAPLIPP